MNMPQITPRRFVVGCATVLLGLTCSMGCRPAADGLESPSATALAATIEVETQASLPTQVAVATAPAVTESVAPAPAVDAATTLLALAPDAANEPPAAPQRPLNTTFD